MSDKLKDDTAKALKGFVDIVVGTIELLEAENATLQAELALKEKMLEVAVRSIMRYAICTTEQSWLDRWEKRAKEMIASEKL